MKEGEKSRERNRMSVRHERGRQSYKERKGRKLGGREGDRLTKDFIPFVILAFIISFGLICQYERKYDNV